MANKAEESVRGQVMGIQTYRFYEDSKWYSNDR
jgi:hypothetical protein